MGEPTYSLSLGVPKYETGLYSEHWHLELEGRCIAPAKHAGRVVRLLFLAERDFFERRRADPDWRPLCLGRLMLRKDRADYMGTIPFDTAWGVAAGVAARTFRYVHLDGERLRGGSANIRYMSFQARYDERDYFDE